MKKAISLSAIVFLTGCVQPPMPMSYYLAKQQEEHEKNNRVKRNELEKSLSENSCDIFWRSLRTKNIVHLNELKNGQICLDLKYQIHNLPSVYIDSEKISFIKSYNEIKVILSSILSEKTTLSQGLNEINNLYENNNASAIKEINKSNRMIQR